MYLRIWIKDTMLIENNRKICEFKITVVRKRSPSSCFLSNVLGSEKKWISLAKKQPGRSLYVKALLSQACVLGAKVSLIWQMFTVGT